MRWVRPAGRRTAPQWTEVERPCGGSREHGRAPAGVNEGSIVSLWIRNRPVDNPPGVPVICYGAVTSTPALPECPDTDAVTVAVPAVSPAVTVKVAVVWPVKTV